MTVLRVCNILRFWSQFTAFIEKITIVAVFYACLWTWEMLVTLNRDKLILCAWRQRKICEIRFGDVDCCRVTSSFFLLLLLSLPVWLYTDFNAVFPVRECPKNNSFMFVQTVEMCVNCLCEKSCWHSKCLYFPSLYVYIFCDHIKPPTPVVLDVFLDVFS